MSGMRYDARSPGKETSRFLVRLIVARRRGRREIPPALETLPGRYIAGKTRVSALGRGR
ncbi:MAG: hypothetical protein N3A38_01130 [Planctomycetota bacterium]|nr:hypothetical protein [Planctomycetota bacterium]